MTNLQALQAMIDWSVNSNLLTKILTDREVASSSTYSGGASEKKSIDLCYADLLVSLANNPDIKEGAQAISFDREKMLRTAMAIYEKHGESMATVNGAAIW